jgi:hypothetical protein
MHSEKKCITTVCLAHKWRYNEPEVMHMDRNEFERLSEAIKRDRDLKLAAIQLEYKRKLDVMRQAMEIASVYSTTTIAPTQEATPHVDERGDTPARERGQLARAIRNAIAKAAEPFVLRDIYNIILKDDAVLGQSVKLASISSFLQKHAEKGRLRVIAVGVGKNPTKYGRPLNFHDLRGERALVSNLLDNPLGSEQL